MTAEGVVLSSRCSCSSGGRDHLLTGRLLLYLYVWLDKLFLKLSAQPDEMKLCHTVHSYLRL